LWILKFILFIYLFCRSPPLVPTLSHVNSVHTASPCFCNIHFNKPTIPRSTLRNLSVPFLQSFEARILYTFPMYLRRATYTTYITFGESVILITFGQTHFKNGTNLDTFPYVHPNFYIRIYFLSHITQFQ
jgi:hypothetical protein